MDHKLVIFPNGTASVRPGGSSEAMHSSIGAWEEANSLYVAQARLAERLLLPDQEPLVLYDIGMGIAANVLAAIRCAGSLSLESRRGLKIVSFEKDLDGLRLALQHREHFAFYEGMEPALHELLSKRRWFGPGVDWELREGDFAREDLSHGPEPEVIFYDFYSPKSADSPLWGYQSFLKIHAACARRRQASKSVSLFTYSSATAVRAALLLAGFHVGVGVATAAKRETTAASTRRDELARPLDQKWLGKFLRSDKPLPADWPQARLEEARERIKAMIPPPSV